MQVEKIINTAYSFGAAVVVFGAWAKLGHKDYSEIALTTGLLTETGIFCIYGLMEWRKLPAAGSNLQQTAGAQPPTLPHPHSPAGGIETVELTDTLKQTNRILNKVFKAE
jgi:hypothetical protein